MRRAIYPGSFDPGATGALVLVHRPPHHRLRRRGLRKVKGLPKLFF